jgi:hypothetical protein
MSELSASHAGGMSARLAPLKPVSNRAAIREAKEREFNMVGLMVRRFSTRRAKPAKRKRRGGQWATAPLLFTGSPGAAIHSQVSVIAFTLAGMPLR